MSQYDYDDDDLVTYGEDEDILKRNYHHSLSPPEEDWQPSNTLTNYRNMIQVSFIHYYLYFFHSLFFLLPFSYLKFSLFPFLLFIRT